jgi:hypothetical protein
VETVRDILAAHRSGISRPGLLAWARLRIDPAMTDAQLEEELTRLGDEVVDDEGFLYLRANLGPGRLAASRAAAEPAWGRWTDDEPGAAPSAAEPGPGGASGRRWPPARVSTGSDGCGGCVGKLVGLAFVLAWAFGMLGGILDGASDEPGGASDAPGVAVAWTDLAIGDCFTWSEEGGGTIRRLACDEPHGYELYEIAAHPGAAFPGEPSFGSFSEDVCPRAFAAYTGTWPDDRPELTWFWWSPSEAEWTDGTRSVACMLAPADGSLTDRSYRSGF